ncbi:MAG: hypothetical protein ABI614_26315 [Planctomycetota bacterium]
MPRSSKPFFRKQTKSWYCSVGGKQISLGKEREAAFDKFYKMMSNKAQLTSDLSTLYDISQVYLT